MVRSLFLLALMVCCGPGFADPPGGVDEQRKTLAEEYFRGVYGCDSSVVDRLAGDGIVVSYPIFAELYGTNAIRGKAAVKAFADGFCEVWKEAQITVHAAVAEGAEVVLVWSFSARNAGTRESGAPATDRVHSWGGITLIQFDADGRIVVETGEESEPGPFARLQSPENPPEGK